MAKSKVEQATGSVVSKGPARLMWRGLVGFWAIIALGTATGAGILHYLGPLNPVEHVAEQTVPSAVHDSVVSTPEIALTARAAISTPVAHILPAAAPEAPAYANATLLEPSTLYTNGQLPRIGVDGRMARKAYAASFDTSDTRPRVAILLAGIGMNEADSMAALGLPPPVSLAITPYATRLERFVPAARAAGHELLLSLPMEPQGFPLNDPGDHALLTGASSNANAQLLEWALTRFTSYVGVTGALGTMRGERFAAALDQMNQVQDTLADRGLLYVDPRPNVVWTKPHASRLPSRGIDVVLDDPQGSAEIDKALARLEKVARDRGSAMGLAGRPSPLTIDRIAVWVAGLDARGLALAPISVVVQMPAVTTPPITLSSRTVYPP